MLPIYAFYIASEDLGLYDFIQSLIGLFLPVMLFAIWESVFKNLIQENDTLKIKAIVNTVNIFAMIVFFIVAIISFFISFTTTISAQIISLTVLLFISQSISQLWQYYARGLKRSQLYTKSSIIGGIFFLCSSILFIVVLDFKIEGLFYSFIISQISIFFIIEKHLNLLKIFGVHDFDLIILRNFLTFSSPLVLNHLSIWLISGASQIIITGFLGSSSNGLFTFANRFSIVVNLFATVISMVVLEEVYKYSCIEEFATKFKLILKKLVNFYFALLIIYLPALNIYYFFLNDTVYYVSRNYLPLLLFSSVIASISNSLGSAFLISNKTKYIFFTTLIGAVVSITGSLLFVDQYGIYSILIFQATGNLAIALLRGIFAKYMLSVKYMMGYTFTFIMYFVIISLLMMLNNIIVILILFLIGVVLSYVINKEDVKFLFLSIIK